MQYCDKVPVRKSEIKDVSVLVKSIVKGLGGEDAKKAVLNILEDWESRAPIEGVKLISRVNTDIQENDFIQSINDAVLITFDETEMETA